MALREIERLAAQWAAARDAALVGEAPRRRAHGIVHTPAELARAVVRVSDGLLRARLEIAGGIADPSLLVLDPACGPGAFLAAAIAAVEDAAGPTLRAVGFDVDAEALALAARLREHRQGAAIELVEADVLASDVVEARARAHRGVVVFLGNPPWTTTRAQPSPRDQARLERFRTDASGVRLAERKLGVLSDAYVRFVALCEQAASSCDAGALVALVTNGSFLDGPVHRGMRARLLATFDEIGVLDLGGSALLGRRRDERDDNVFGVRPGVAVSWFCRHPRQRRSGERGVASYVRRRGSRAAKLEFLSVAGLPELELAPLACEAPAFSFVPRPRQKPRYAAAPALSEWLPFHREGVQSNRDSVVMDMTAEGLMRRLWAFSRGERLAELAPAYRALPHYDPERARSAVREALTRDPSGSQGLVLQRIGYRPFDERVFCPTTPLCHRPRPQLSAALAHGGFALVSVRKDRGDLAWSHAGAAACAVDNCFLSARSSCRARVFPSFTPEGEPNLAPSVREQLAAVGCGDVSVVEVQHYLLCVLSAGGYRAAWESELHHDYPRVPAPPDAETFQQLAELGAQLAAVHAGACETPWISREPQPGARFGDLELDPVDGGLRLSGTLLITLSAEALAVRIGHHAPLAAYIHQRAGLRLDAEGLGAVYTRAERLNQLARLHHEADVAVAARLAAYCGG